MASTNSLDRLWSFRRRRAPTSVIGSRGQKRIDQGQNRSHSRLSLVRGYPTFFIVFVSLAGASIVAFMFLSPVQRWSKSFVMDDYESSVGFPFFVESRGGRNRHILQEQTIHRPEHGGADSASYEWNTNLLLSQPHLQKEESFRIKKSSCPVGSRIPSADSRFIGDLFQRLSTDPAYAHLSPAVQTKGGQTVPWVLVLNNFLSDHEVSLAMRHLTNKTFSVSGVAVADGRYSNYQYRRSETHSCGTSCMEEPWVAPIVSRMSEVTGLDMRHAEEISFKHYGQGGFYGRHHDYILNETDPRTWANCGNRILTLLVYLNDVDEGGETCFFHYDMNVMPKRGRALLFPNVFPDKPWEKDERTAHEAKVVKAGEKYIAQTWFYFYDYTSNMKSGCCF